MALGWAEVLGATDLFCGVNAVDYSGYPDCRPEFVAGFEALANLATKAGVEGSRFRVHAPLMRMTKADIVREGLRLGVDFSQTVSCYQADADGRACGHCDACRLRAFRRRRRGRSHALSLEFASKGAAAASSKPHPCPLPAGGRIVALRATAYCLEAGLVAQSVEHRTLIRWSRVRFPANPPFSQPSLRSQAWLGRLPQELAAVSTFGLLCRVKIQSNPRSFLSRGIRRPKLTSIDTGSYRPRGDIRLGSESQP